MRKSFVTSLWAAAVVVSCVFSVSVSAATKSLGSKTSLTGEQKQWHKVSLTFPGPFATETGTPNPFSDYRLNVTFTHTATNRRIVVPGYFAADGDAANTSAVSGDKWRVEFAPDATGTWTYLVSFRTGANVAVSTSSAAGTATSINGEAGSFTIDPTDKGGVDFRGKGRLQDVGQHYLQFLGSKEYFIKIGAGSPENFLAFGDFDATTAGKSILHHYAVHVSNFRSGDPTWKGGKGKGIIGAIDYLSSKGVNSQYFLTMNIGGDGDDVVPFVSKTDRTHYDVSKLAQWEIVFSHMDKMGVALNMFTQERENDQLLDGGALGNQRKLYYRELIARFGHHLGVTWNLGEENSNTASQRTAFADYFNALDPYQHLIAVHTWPSERSTIYTPMLGNDVTHGAALQIESPSLVHAEVLKWVSKSAAAGSKWIVSLDELGSASSGVVPDSNDPTHADVMHRALWGTLMAGGSGVEWYFGYSYANNDLNCENWTTRAKMWTLSSYAAGFMRSYMPLPLVQNYDGITSSTVDYVLGKAGVAYAVYLPDGATTNITLPAGEAYTVKWFNPRAGGALQDGTVKSVAGGTVALGMAPAERNLDWVVLLRRTTSSGSTPAPIPAPAPTPGPAPAPGPVGPTAVTSLSLVNTGTQKTIRSLTSGATISLSKDGAININANTSGTIGSVTFTLNGKFYKMENLAPYSVAGDNAGKYLAWKAAPGSYTITVTPSSGTNGGGTVGKALSLSFKIVN
jgi:hypothetical protein